MTGAGRADGRSVSLSLEIDGKRLSVLEDLSLHVPAGGFPALPGPSWCGKSTLLRLIAGPGRPCSRPLAAGGAVITGPNPSRAVVFQDPALYPWRTVRADTEPGFEAQGRLHCERHKAGAALAPVGLRELAGACPHQLSGGMVQRAALARALVNEPRLLLLDEPLGKLDSLTRMAMQREPADLWLRERFTVVMVTHGAGEAPVMTQQVFVPRLKAAALASGLAAYGGGAAMNAYIAAFSRRIAVPQGAKLGGNVA